MSFKLIVSGNYFQFKSSYIPQRSNAQKAQKTREHNKTLKDKYGIDPLPNGSYQKRKDNLSRVRNNFKLLAHANTNAHSKFITLTTQTPLTIEQLREALHKWLKQLKRDVKETKLKYIGVYEYQERGAPHIHLIFFNSVFIKWDKALKHWRSIIGGLGSLQIKQLQAIKHINYLIAYLNETCIKELNQKSIIRSVGLEKPKVYKDNIPPHLETKFLKVEYSRIMGSKQTDNTFENIYGYLTNERQEFNFDDAKDFLRVSIIRLNRFSQKGSKIPQNEDSK